MKPHKILLKIMEYACVILIYDMVQAILKYLNA